MSGICGWLGHLEDFQSPALILAQMANALNQSGSCTARSMSSLSAGLYVIDGHLFSGDTLWVGINGYPYISDDVFDNYSDFANNPAEWIATHYRYYGNRLLEYLSGSFSLVILDFEAEEALLAIDRMGISSLCYSDSSNMLIFATTIGGLGQHPALSSSIDHQSIFDYLYFSMVPSPNTFHNQYKKMQPAEKIVYRKGKVKSSFYWRPVFDKDATTSIDTLSDHLRSLLRKSVLRCSPDANTGAFLSGGIDSSTIVGLLTEITDQPVTACSIGFSTNGYDETVYADLAARHFRARHHKYYITPKDVADTIPKIAEAYDEPFGNSSAVAVYFCARMAKEVGLHRLLAGDGGDELFAGNIRYARQKLFEWYFAIPSKLRRMIVEPVVLNMPYSRFLFPIRKAQRYIQQAKTSLPERLRTYNFLYGIPPEKVFSADLLAAVNINHPLFLLEETYRSIRSEEMLDRVMHLDWKFTLADNDLRKVNRMCELAGIEVYYPLLDDEIVEFSTHILLELKLKRLKLRYFFKEAMKDLLPRQTIVKPKQGFALPFGVWLEESSELQELAYDSLLALKSRGYLKSEFIDSLITVHKARSKSHRWNDVWTKVMQETLEQGKVSQSAFCGNMIYVLLMLELWFESHNS
jgi:asparagine synthase (glutamine-hydrolysing)